jgi:hypothetical protein
MYTERRTTQDKIRLAEAYYQVFFGTPDNAQRDTVFVHLANASGYYRATGPNLSPDERAWNEGRRSMFGEIISRVHMTDSERMSLEKATRHEYFLEEVEGR